jgi:8-oxo-dGTP pyrophosphatase MutT (NUDIX family)
VTGVADTVLPLVEAFGRYRSRWLLGDVPAALQEGQASALAAMAALLRDAPHSFTRGHFEPGHFTGSALVVDDRNRVLLTLHRRLGKWLQLGGHADGDLDLARVALREAQEESGVESLRYQGAPSILDVDVHPIPRNDQEPEHKHFDVRYVVLADRAQAEAIRASDESTDLKWFSFDEALAAVSEGSLRRLIEKYRYAASRGWLNERPR